MNSPQTKKAFTSREATEAPADVLTAIMLRLEPDLVNARSLAALILEALSTDKPIPEELRDGWCYVAGELCAALDGAYAVYREIAAARRRPQH